MRNIKLQDLFTQLEKYKNDLTYLFTKQLLNEPVSKLSFISDTEKEKMDFILQEYGILVEDDGCIKFDSQSFDYFSDVLNINGNINLAVVLDLVEDVRNLILYCEKDDKNKDKYIARIKDKLYNIGRKTQNGIRNLRQVITDTYKQMNELEIKKMELEKLDKRRKNIEDIILQTIGLLVDEENFFKAHGVNTQVWRTQNILRDCSHEVTELHLQIVEFIFKTEKQSSEVRKIKRLKGLLDRRVFDEATDIQSVMNVTNDLFFDKSEQLACRLSVSQLYADDEVFQFIKEIQKRLEIKKEESNVVSKPIDDSFFHNLCPVVEEFDIDSIAESFKLQGYDLFNFLLNYPFKRKLQLDEIQQLFAQICSDKYSELLFTDATATYRHVIYKIVKPKD